MNFCPTGLGGTMKETLFNEKLITREFGSLVFSVAELTDWARSKRIVIPTIHNLECSKFVQVEYFLSAIQNPSYSLTESEALQIVEADEQLKTDSNSKLAPNFAIGAQVSDKWRALIKAGIDSDELRLLSFGTKLPIDAEAKDENSNPEIDIAALATRTELINAFGKFTGMDKTWFLHLADTPKLKTARKFKGKSGRHSVGPLFCPYEVMQWLIDPKRRKGVMLSNTTGWRILRNKFPKTYDANSKGDPTDY